MRIINVATLAAASASTAIATQSNGILPGETIAVMLSSPDGLFAGSAQLQTSPDNVTFTNVGSAMTANGTKVNAVLADRFLRLNCTARTAGTIDATIIATTG